MGWRVAKGRDTGWPLSFWPMQLDRLNSCIDALPWCNAWSTCINSFKPPQQPSKTGTVPILIFQTRKQRHRELQSFALGHTAHKGSGCTFQQSGFTVIKLTHYATLTAVKIRLRERKKSVPVNDNSTQTQGPKRDPKIIRRDCGV